MTRVRRWWLFVPVLVALAVAGVLLLTRDTDEPPRAKAARDQHFVTRPDLTPPVMTAKGVGSGFFLLAPKRRAGQGGPAILDARGELMWFKPMAKGVVADDFKVQIYDGERVLTWWEGKTVPERGYGSGTWVIADRSYKEVARVKAGNGLTGDLHEMLLTDRGTALIVIYHAVKADLSVVNSYKDGEVMDSLIQEIDVKTGEVLWEWSALDHVALGESFAGVPQKNRFAYDFFHINSIDEDADGDLLISARNTWAIYKIDKKTGDIVWRLGGRRSDFALGEGVRFAWQHDARWQDDGKLTLFDNQATPKVGPQSRALRLRLDEERRTAGIEDEFTHPDKILAIAEGNADLQPAGGVVVGWGLGRRVSEFDALGKLLFDLALPGDTDTYRAFADEWIGEPAEPPTVVAEREGDEVVAHVSWNGATAVTGWTLLAGSSAANLERVAERERTGFETELRARTDATFVAVKADDGATSPPVRVR